LGPTAISLALGPFPQTGLFARVIFHLNYTAYHVAKRELSRNRKKPIRKDVLKGTPTDAGNCSILPGSRRFPQPCSALRVKIHHFCGKSPPRERGRKLLRRYIRPRNFCCNSRNNSSRLALQGPTSALARTAKGLRTTTEPANEIRQLGNVVLSQLNARGSATTQVEITTHPPYQANGH